MSRRTKLIALSVFLVLLGVVAIGAWHIWHPRNPLRISLALEQDPSPPEGSSSPIMPLPYYVVVENTGDIPVLLLAADLVDSSTVPIRSREGKGVISPYYPGNSDTPADPTHWLIPPRSSIRCAVLPLAEGSLAIVQRGQTEVSYAWRTPMNRRYSQCREWVRNHAPPWISELLMEPDYFRDSTQLLVSPPQPAQ